MGEFAVWYFLLFLIKAGKGGRVWLAKIFVGLPDGET